jgi:osmotically-inducible protein OsmY
MAHADQPPESLRHLRAHLIDPDISMIAQLDDPRVNHLHDEVERALSRTAWLAGRNLRIEVHEQGITLRGVVRSYYHKQLAQESLRSIPGIPQISNEIEVVTV